MKLTTILTVLAAAATTTVADNTNNNNNNNTTTSSIIQALPLNYTLAPNAVELLQSHGLWAPDPAAFAAGTPNVDGVNVTAEVERFRGSGLDANEVVGVSIDNTAAAWGLVPAAPDAAAADAAPAEYKDCQQCDGCQTDCLILILFLPFYGACIGGCMDADYCKGCGLV